MKEYPRDNVAFVRIGYCDACTDFTVRFREYSRAENRFSELKKAIRAAGQYNEFEPGKVVSAIEKIAHLVQEIQFGREGSPVMYLHLISGKSQGTGDSYQWRKFTGRELLAVEKQVKAAFTSTVFDEWNRTSDIIRVWWD